MNQNTLVGMLIVRHTDRGWEHLQLHRAPGRYMEGTWSLCRGGLEPGETALAGALREMKEETGLKPIELYRLSTLETFHTDHDDTIWTTVFFVSVVAENSWITLNNEHDAFRWVPDREIFPNLAFPGEHALVQEVQTFILPEPARYATKALQRIALPTA